MNVPASITGTPVRVQLWVRLLDHELVWLADEHVPGEAAPSKASRRRSPGLPGSAPSFVGCVRVFTWSEYEVPCQ